MRILRIQDSSGRGPWIPGFSHAWLDVDRPALPAPIFETVKNFSSIVEKAHANGLHIGCAAKEDCLSMWVSTTEMEVLKKYGFSVVNATQCRIIAEDENQVLIVSKKPFKKLPKVNL